jgi:hypothetical protein
MNKEINDYKLSERVLRVVFLVALIVVCIDLMIWRP